MTIIELVLSAVAIVVAAALFTNAVEILGDRLDLGQGVVGSVLAAVGTALPETMIPIVAVVASLFTGSNAAGEVGVGAILGAPFLLATLAMFVVGVSVLAFRRRESDDDVMIDKGTARRDMLFFLVFFSLGAGAGIVELPSFVKAALAVLLVVAYALYVWRTLKSGGESIENPPEKLTLWRSRSWGYIPLCAGQEERAHRGRVPAGRGNTLRRLRRRGDPRLLLTSCPEIVTLES
jgi:cation:H+ antiporter